MCSVLFQVAEKIRTHECVSVIERTNLRYLTQLPQLVDLVTLDLSFISILLVRFCELFIVYYDTCLVATNLSSLITFVLLYVNKVNNAFACTYWKSTLVLFVGSLFDLLYS